MREKESRGEGTPSSGWHIDPKTGAWMRDTIHHMGRRLPGFDYAQRRIYEITIVLQERRPLLGRLVKKGTAEWLVEPSAWGEVVLACWCEIAARWPQIELLEDQLMPDHFHGVLFVREALPLTHPNEAEGPRNRRKKLGDVIQGFKAGCSIGWRGLAGGSAPLGRGRDGLAPAAIAAGSPRWAEGFVDTILFGKGQLDAMINYLRDNPRRLGVKREHPELFKVTRGLAVPGIGRFSAIGNHFLLSRPKFHQIQVSRRFFAYARDARGKPLKDAPPAVVTPEFQAKLAAALAAAKGGAVLISPCISPGEREIARRAFAAGCRLITLSNKGFNPLYKPGGRLFDQCADGNLLMLAPVAWPYLPAEKPMTRVDALVLNRIAQLLAGEGAVDIDYKGVRIVDVDRLVANALSP